MNRREAIAAVGLMACCGSLPVVEKPFDPFEGLVSVWGPDGIMIWNRALHKSEIRNVRRATKREESAHPNLWDGLVFPVAK
jgi:hypothetical protein